MGHNQGSEEIQNNMTNVMFFLKMGMVSLRANSEGESGRSEDSEVICGVYLMVYFMNVIKASFYNGENFSARWFQTWGTLLLGSMVIATGYTFFMTPYQIVPGGIYGISTILNWKLGFSDWYGSFVF